MLFLVIGRTVQACEQKSAVSLARGVHAGSHEALSGCTGAGPPQRACGAEGSKALASVQQTAAAQAQHAGQGTCICQVLI